MKEFKIIPVSGEKKCYVESENSKKECYVKNRKCGGENNDNNFF